MILRPYKALRLAQRRLDRVYACYDRQRAVAVSNPNDTELVNAVNDLALALYGSYPAITRRK